jgi:hypothetical protein
MQWRPNHEEKDSQVKDNEEGNRGKWELWSSFTDDLKRYAVLNSQLKTNLKNLRN